MEFQYETWMFDNGVTSTQEEVELELIQNPCVVVIEPEDQIGKPELRRLPTNTRAATNGQGLMIFHFTNILCLFIARAYSLFHCAV
jgi:hypothetical protein